MKLDSIEAIGVTVVGITSVIAMIYLASCGHIGDMCHVPGWTAPVWIGAWVAVILWVVFIPDERGFRGWWKRRKK